MLATDFVSPCAHRAVPVRKSEMTAHYRSDQPNKAFSTENSVLVTRRRGLYRNSLKRVLDVVVVLLGAPFVFPMIVFLAFLVALDGGKPFYSQDRVGKAGRIYRMWKLRSMVVDADSKLSAFLAENPEARAEWAYSQKLRHDPRITRLGQLLRRSSLDELPQLWNVLRGDMSLVGPRPMMPSQRGLYPGDAYYRLRPGITGLWQVSARNESSFGARAIYDSDYDQTLSLGTDVQILMATVKVVTRGTGC
jgi:exopolysaccharide production protein ExoY